VTGRSRSVAATLLLAAGTALAGVATAPAASANGPCNYGTLDSAYVRENPSINSVVRKTVPARYGVTGPAPCGSRTGTDGRQWVPVDCGCATDGIGWIIADKLQYFPV
jgi:hypothetical protein